MLNLSILSFSSSFLFATNSPLFVNNHYTAFNCNFQRFASSLFYNQKYLKIDSSFFNKGLGCIVFNSEEEIKEQETFLNREFTSPLEINVGIKSISIINCKFSEINNQNSIDINGKEISVYITSSTFSTCKAIESLIHLKRSRCLTMTHVCTYNSGASNVNSEGAILYYDMIDTDFTLCLYNSFVESSMSINTYVVNIVNGNQYLRCNNLTESDGRGFHFNSPECFSFGLSTVSKCKNYCFSISGYNAIQCPTVKNKLMEMSNFVNDADCLFECHGICDYTLTINQCLLLNQKENSNFVNKESTTTIVITNCLVVKIYENNNNVIFNNCAFVDYDESRITIYAHYTNEVECVGPENVDKIEGNCEKDNCIDKECGEVIEFPTDVYHYTTLCHECTTIFSDSQKFSESIKFSESFKFSQSEQFVYSNEFSSNNDFSTFIHTSYTDEFSSEISVTIESSNDDIALDPGNQGSNSKGTNKAMIGAIVGVLAVVVIAAIVATVLIIKKRKRLNVTTEANMAETDGSGVTTENHLKNVMEEDDPFAGDFNAEEL